MATIRVDHNIGALAKHYAAVPAKFRRFARVAVRVSLEEGTDDAKRHADAAAGPHGSNYSKRISWEMTGALEGEYGPHAPKTDYVGVSGAEGAMRDLEKSALRLGPRFQKRVGFAVDRALK